MKINLILLASGNSKRFNGNKLLAEVNGKPMYMHIVDKVNDINFNKGEFDNSKINNMQLNNIESINRNNFNFNKIIIVTQYKEIRDNLKGYNIDIIMNEESFLGISSSISLGINADKSADGFMFMVCDQPFIKEETIQRLVKLFINGNKGIVSTSFNGCTRNPVIFSKKYINDLLSLSGDVGGNKVLKNNLNDLNLVEVSDILEVEDIDTREEIIKIIQKS